MADGEGANAIAALESRHRPAVPEVRTVPRAGPRGSFNFTTTTTTHSTRMKSKQSSAQVIRVLILGAALASAGLSARAQDVVVTRFEDGNYVTNGIWSWWGGATRS